MGETARPNKNRIRSTLARAIFCGWLATTAGCSSNTINDPVVEGLGCKDGKTNFMPVIFRGLQPDDRIAVGHPETEAGGESPGIVADVFVGVGQDGKIIVDKGDRTVPERADITIAVDGVHTVITADEEIYTVRVINLPSDKPGSGRNLQFEGSCAK